MEKILSLPTVGPTHINVFCGPDTVLILYLVPSDDLIVMTTSKAHGSSENVLTI